MLKCFIFRIHLQASWEPFIIIIIIIIINIPAEWQKNVTLGTQTWLDIIFWGHEYPQQIYSGSKSLTMMDESNNFICFHTILR